MRVGALKGRSLRVAFAGTPAFAQVALERIHAAGFEVPLVLTQPDRPAGRGMQVMASPVKAFALAQGLPLAQPHSLRLDGKFDVDAASAREALQSARIDVMVVAAYGLILPSWLLALPPLGCINIHASLLPRWRGAAPIQRAIEAGDRETGVTLMQMDEGLDTGDVLAIERVPVAADATAASLLEQLTETGARLIVAALHDVGSLQRNRQPETGVTYARKILKDEAAIDWRSPAALIERRLRAFDPFPGASASLAGERVKCWRGEVVVGSHDANMPGRVIEADASGIRVACGEHSVRITTLQRAGGRRVDAAQFLQAAPLRVGMQFDPKIG